MAIVIDVNVFSEVFKTTHKDHAHYAPVRNFVREGLGTLIYGGTKYKNEIRYCSKVLLELNKINRARPIDDASVDKRERQLAEKLNNTQCNDQHLLALLDVSGCKIICTKDVEFFPFIKDKDNYSDRRARKIYQKSSLACADEILTIRNIPQKYRRS